MTDRDDGAFDPRSAGRPSLKDVARVVGVSTATVSRALTMPRKLDAETLARVEDAIKTLGYVRHGAARALRRQRTQTIAAVVPSFDYALYARTTSAMQQVLEPLDYALVLAAHQYDLGKELQATRRLIERGAEAFMFVGALHDPDLFVMLRRARCPYVLTWVVDQTGEHPSVGFDNCAATAAAVRHLFDLGHRSFGLISAFTEGNDRAAERGIGVRETLGQLGLSLSDDRVVYGPISLASGGTAMRTLLTLPGPPTAIIATNDVFAVGAMMACREAGVRVPGDVAITGVDNTDLGATQTPGLTSIATPTIEIGCSAATFLTGCLDGNPHRMTSELAFELIVRGSTVMTHRD